MTKHRGNIRPRQGLLMENYNNNSNNKIKHNGAVASNKNQEVVLSSSPCPAQDKAYVERIRQKAKELRALASPSRSCTSDSVSLETEGTGVSTLTSSSGGREQHHQQQQRRLHNHLPLHPRTRVMISPARYTIFEDEMQSRATQSSYISRPIDVDSMQEYEEEEEEIQSRTTHSSSVSRPIDVDSMQEYEEETKPSRPDADDSRSRTTASTYSSRPIDVDSVLEYDPEDDADSRLAEDRFEKIMNVNDGYYEGESLLEYSSDDDSIDFETGFAADSRNGQDGPEITSVSGKDRSEPERKVSSLKQLQSPTESAAVSVDLLGPIHLDTCYLLTVGEDESVEEASFRDWEFPILDERDFDRELVGYIEGFEPVIEDLPPRARLGRKQSDATSTRSSSTRVTFEI